MTEIKNVTEIVVLKLSRKSKYLDVLEAALGQNLSSSTLLVTCTTDDTTMHGYGHTLETTHTKFKAHPPTANKEDEQTAIEVIVNAYNDNAGIMQGIARNAAIAAGGNVNVGINIVKNANYKLKSSKSPTEIVFDVANEGSGKVKVTSKSRGIHAGYIRQYGPTSAKGIPPEKCEEMLFGLEVDLIIDCLKPGIYGIREASILPISRKADSGTPTTLVESKATASAASKSHKRIYSAGSTSKYNWSEWIYFTIL